MSHAITLATLVRAPIFFDNYFQTTFLKNSAPLFLACAPQIILGGCCACKCTNTVPSRPCWIASVGRKPHLTHIWTCWRRRTQVLMMFILHQTQPRGPDHGTCSEHEAISQLAAAVFTKNILLLRVLWRIACRQHVLCYGPTAGHSVACFRWAQL